jgi:hypothetical protein
MAAEYAKDNEKALVKKHTRPVGATDLYMAHFLGASAAGKFLAARDEGKGGQSAATLFPGAAKANESIFYKKGTPRSLNEVYDIMASKMARADYYRSQARS